MKFALKFGRLAIELDRICQRWFLVAPSLVRQATSNAAQTISAGMNNQFKQYNATVYR